MSDNTKLPPQLKRLVEDARLTRSLGLIFGAFSWLGVGGTSVKEWSRQAKDLSHEAEELAALPTEFQSRLQSHGWLLSESTSVASAQEAIALYDEGKIDEANTLLCTQYEGDKLDFLLMRMKSVPEFLPRYEIARSAAALSQAGQFVAAVPLIFITLDGIATDAFGKSIFSEGIDLSETKALAGRADGFPQVIGEVSKIRRKTNLDEIFFPFRNGIIHGKDTNYGNRFVTAKCWGLLSCLGDILRAKRASEVAMDDRTLGEVLKDYIRTGEKHKRLEGWSPRERVEVSGEGAFQGQDFLEASPENVLCRFLDSWYRKNYGRMGETTAYFDKRPVRRRAGQIRQDLSGIDLVGARIVDVTDEAPAVTEIRCLLTIRVDSEEKIEEFRFRLVYIDEDMNPLMRGEAGGEWLIMPAYQGWAMGKRFGR